MGFLTAVGLRCRQVPRSHHNGIQAAFTKSVAHRAAGCISKLTPRSTSAGFGNANCNPEALDIGRSSDGFRGSNPQRPQKRTGNGQFAIAAPGAIAGGSRRGRGVGMTGTATDLASDHSRRNYDANRIGRKSAIVR